MELLNEQISREELKNYMKEFYNYAAKRLDIDKAPRVFLRNDKNNADDIFGKTGGYDPEAEEIHLYITDRHPKDVLRSFAHELVHHRQKLRGEDKKVDISLIHKDPAYSLHNNGLRRMEAQAFKWGNLIFRDWTDTKKLERNNIMNEVKKKKKKKSKVSFQDKVDAVADSLRKQGRKGKGVKKSAQNIVGAMVAGEKKEESKHQKAARMQAEADAKHRFQNDKLMDEQEAVEALQENKEKESETVHPYPQLFQEKPRLMQDAFNKKEDLVYQELIRRFIKK